MKASTDTRGRDPSGLVNTYVFVAIYWFLLSHMHHLPLAQRIRRLQAQISNLNRRYVSAQRAEALGKNVGHVLNVEERTLFVLGMGDDHCHPEVVRSTFGVFGEIERVRMFKRYVSRFLD